MWLNISHDLTTELLILKKKKTYYLNKCESERDDELFFVIRTINKNKVTECNGPSEVVSSWLTVVWEPGTLASWN